MKHLREVLAVRFGNAPLPEEVAEHLEKLEQTVREARQRSNA